MPSIPSKDASFVWGTPRNYALTNDHGSAFCLNTLHDALDAGVTLTQSQNRDSLLKYYKMEIFLSKIDVKELDK